MRITGAVILALMCTPLASFGTTSHDLRSRITVDGSTGDYAADEWVLDGTTAFPESSADSRWGRDEEIAGIAVTWDDFHLYIAVAGVVRNGSLMLFLDTACGGLEHLYSVDLARRRIEFGAMTPNVLIEVARAAALPLVLSVDCRSSLKRIDPDRLESVFVQNGTESGVFELAVPWDLLGDFDRTAVSLELPSRGQVLRVLAAVTGGSGTGAGDSAPDPSVALESDSTRPAILDNHLVIPLDGDGDRLLDTGISPRAVATTLIGGKAPVGQVLPLQIVLEKKIFAPETGESLRFYASLDPPEFTFPVYLTARVYSSGGRCVRTLFEREPRNLSGGPPVVEAWDGTDDGGRIVPGGIYVLAVSAGPAPGSATKTVKAALAVIR